MEAVSANYQIEMPRFGMLEFDVHQAFVLVNFDEAVTEQNLASTLEVFINDRCQLTARYAHIPAFGRRPQDVRIEPSDPSSMRVHEPKLFYIEAAPVNLRKYSHPLSYVITAAPKIDEVPFGAQMWRYFDERDLETVNS
jgi:hypothetical protein